MAERISLTEVIHKLQAGDESAVYFDRSRGRLCALEPAAVAPDGFERLPLSPNTTRWSGPGNFAKRLRTRKIASDCAVALTTLDAREAFEAALFRSRIANEWFQFRDERLVQRAKEWLESRQIPYDDDVTRAAD